MGVCQANLFGFYIDLIALAQLDEVRKEAVHNYPLRHPYDVDMVTK